MLREVASQVGVLFLCEELLVVSICDWRVWRSGIALREETRLARGVNWVGSSSPSIDGWSAGATFRRGSGEREVDGVGEEPEGNFLLVMS